MRKMRDDSTWNQLTPEQRAMLESWLFDENLGYAQTLERVQKEFGDDASLSHDEKMQRVHAIFFGWNRERPAANGQGKSRNGAT